MSFTNLKNELKTLNFYQAVGLLAISWVVVLLFVLSFVSINGHQSWWQSRFHHKTVFSQATSPVPQTEDNKARLFVLNFYRSYNGTTDAASKKSLVAKNSTTDFYGQYVADKSNDDVTCTDKKVTNVQITSQVLFAKYLSYDIAESVAGDNIAGPTIAVNKVDNSYKIVGVSCGTING